LLPTHPLSRKIALLFFALAPLLYGVLSLAFGQDANWDLRNYHWYNAYAFLNGREGFDILPAQTPSFYNPIIDVPFYLLATHLPARLVGFLLGTVQGLNGIFLFLLAYALLRLENPLQRTITAIIIATAGLLGGGTLGEVGATFYDNVISLGIFGALLVVVTQMETLTASPAKTAFRLAALGGFLMGCAAGLKQPALLYAAGLGLALFTLPTPWRRRFGIAFWFGMGGLAGIALFSGYWMVHLALAYGDPLFPYFNNIFHSPFAELKSYQDPTFIPGDWQHRLFLPLYFAFNPYIVGEVPWRDFSVPLLFVILPVVFIMGWWREAVLYCNRRTPHPPAARKSGGSLPLPQGERVKKQRWPTSLSPCGRGWREAPGEGCPTTHEVSPLNDLPTTRYLLAAMAISYVVWAKMFCIYRYLVPLEMLAPLALMLCMGWLVREQRRAWAAACVLLLLVQITVMRADWGHVPWGERYMQIDMPPLVPDTMLLMAGWHPIGYAATAVPPSVPVIRIHSNFTTPDKPPIRFTQIMHDRIAAHQGPLKILYLPVEEKRVTDALAAYGLAIEPGFCEEVHNGVDVDFSSYRLCGVRRK